MTTSARPEAIRVIVTRPAAQAATWVESLRAHGIDAVALPLIAIAAPADPEAVSKAWAGLAKRGLVVFVSPNAAERFFAQQPEGSSWPRGVLAAAVGPSTGEALKRHGVAASDIVEPAADAAQFDSESLWSQLAHRMPWCGTSVLVVRGDGGRDWLADTLRDQGAKVDFVAAYRRQAPEFDGCALALLGEASAHPRQCLWFFSSSQAIDHLAGARPAADWSASHALATHPRIAERARALGFGSVQETRPGLADVVACIQSRAS